MNGDNSGRAGEVVSLSPLIIRCGQGQLEILQGQGPDGESVSGRVLASQLGLVVGQPVNA